MYCHELVWKGGLFGPQRGLRIVWGGAEGKFAPPPFDRLGVWAEVSARWAGNNPVVSSFPLNSFLCRAGLVPDAYMCFVFFCCKSFFDFFL